MVFVDPDADERRYLVEELQVDEHTLNSALDPDELSRLEYEHDHTAIIYKRPRNYSGGGQLLLKVASVGMFMFKDRLVVVVGEDVPLFDTKQFRKVETLNEVMLKLIARAIIHFLEHLKVIILIVDEIESKINTAMENKNLINLFSLEKSLVYYVNSIHTNNVLLGKMKANAQRLALTTEEQELLEDMMVDNNQCYKQAEIYSNILASLMDARASIVSNNLNVLMKRLTIITLGVMLPTFVVSTFSMNVKYPFNAEASWPFFMIMVLVVLSLAGFYAVIKLLRW
jgi:magnesium transporter